MPTIILGVFLILHGLVHLLYAGQSCRLFELRPDMVWPDGSWLFSRFLGDGITRTPASILLALAALGFVSGGLGLFIRQEWWRPVAMGSAMFSAAIFLLFWDGKFQALADKGGVGILIDLAILVAVLLLKWPS
jgi:hypothetical protein